MKKKKNLLIIFQNNMKLIEIFSHGVPLMDVNKGDYV